jgi:hypothetical protein
MLAGAPHEVLQAVERRIDGLLGPQRTRRQRIADRIEEGGEIVLAYAYKLARFVRRRT